MTISLIELISYSILSIIISSGTIGFIVNHFIKIKIEQSIKHNYNKQLESIKQEYKEKFDLIQKSNDAHFSELKNTKDRYNSKQFEIYNTLWVSLIELKFSADNLWDEATKRRLRIFSKKVAEAQKSIEISSLLLENDDYRELNNLIDKFNDFEIGKETLIKIKYKTDAEMHSKNINEASIEDMIRENGQTKNEYDTLIIKLKEKFKKQIKGNNK
ncbi:hypothetical protein [Aliarcobacter butzleri]|uniref:hypothetical protein n=1 Tax=Aliarcobacter butzleri TaxID=28197 RepID=UPI0021B30932|nr:hypothetical protein [Aliarcobacter butzleri]MCT7576461.1 hypothetical protein [Aliarcobacter butzleri]